jgi:hypothetical protein
MENSKINWWKVAVYTIAIIMLLLTGFLLGRKTIEQPEPDIVYLPGDTITITIDNPPVPVKEVVDTANLIKNCVKNGLFYDLFPEKVKDSIVYLTFTKEDTAKVFNDWATRREYNALQLFDIDTVGSATLNAVVQYNRIMNYGLDFVPVIKQVTVVKKTSKYSPFIGAGLSTLPSLNLSGGYFYGEKMGFLFNYQYDYTEKNHIIGAEVLIKF